MKVDDRDEAIKGLGNGKIQILTSVDVISEGTDVPDVSAAILLRPTKSEGLYLQQVGRVLRPKPDKTAIILDHVNSTRTHGFVDDKREWSLHSQKKKKKKGEVAPNVETCKKCFATYKPTPVCPVCGYQAENRERFIKQEEGELEELKRKEQEETEKKQQKLLIATAKTLEELEMVAKILGYKKGWAYRVYESRKSKSIPRNKLVQWNNKGKKRSQVASNLSLSQKENIAKVFCLRGTQQAFDMLQVYQDGVFGNHSFTEHLTDDKKRLDAAEGIWSLTGRINDANRSISKKLLKNIFMQMFAYPWDRNFIINYVKAVRERKIEIDPDSIYLRP